MWNMHKYIGLYKILSRESYQLLHKIKSENRAIPRALNHSYATNHLNWIEMKVLYPVI